MNGRWDLFESTKLHTLRTANISSVEFPFECCVFNNLLKTNWNFMSNTLMHDKTLEQRMHEN